MTSLSVILSAATIPHHSIGLCSKSDQYASSITVTLCSPIGCCLLLSVTLADIGNWKSLVADNHMDRPVSESVAQNKHCQHVAKKSQRKVVEWLNSYVCYAVFL